MKKVILCCLLVVFLVGVSNLPAGARCGGDGTYWMNERLHNGTGETATNLEKWLDGDVKAMNWISTHFTQFSYGYDKSKNETKVRWYSGVVPDSTTVGACVKLSRYVKQKYLPRWTYPAIDSIIAGPALSFAVDSVGNLVLSNTAEDGGPITIVDIQAKGLETLFPIEMLVSDSLIGEVWDFSNTNILLALDAEYSIGGLDPHGGVLFMANVYLNSDPENVVEYVGQYTPAAHPIPALTEWGMLFLLLMLLAAGIIVIRKRRRAIAH
ncbi:hypothetical protein ACFLQW_04375 [Candidatus Zixiibacteriota bacterium]